MRRNFPDWIKAFTEFASFGEAPLSFYFWTGVSTIAGALRRRVWIDMGHFKWIPNFYVILVAPPGIVSKSTTASIGMNLLRQVKGIKFGPDVVTWQKLAQSLAQSLELFDLGDGTMMPMSAITIESSEFGTFLNPNDREMVDVLVSLWDGKQGAFVKSTKTQGDDVIENPFVNIIACTTPAWLEGNFPEYMIGGGFTSRCIFLFADTKRQYVAYPHLHIPKDFKALEATLVADLECISLLRGEFKLSPDAISWGEAWYERHFRARPPHLDNDRFAGYLARKQTHIHKLGMVISASRRDDLVLDSEVLSFANDLITTLETDMPKVFEKIGTSEESRGASQLVSIVRGLGTVEQGALYRQLFRTLSFDDFTIALKSAIAAGHVSVWNEGNQTVIKAKHDVNTELPSAPSGPVASDRDGTAVSLRTSGDGAATGTEGD